MSIAIPQKLPAPAKAGPIGPGSGVLLTEFPLSLSTKETPQKRMARYWAMSYEVSWIAAAEDAITQRMADVDWHLEDDQDEEIDDQYPNADAVAALMLMEQPAAQLPIGAKFTRSDLWALTGRAMGICGSAFILGDAPEALAGTPSALLPVAPWRMYPDEDEQGNLTGWHIDKRPNSPGIEVPLENVLHYRLRPSFSGHFGVGLMESAMRKISITLGLDDHVNMVISAGGRLSGILSPKSGIAGPDTLLQIERDWRTVVDQSDAAKRLQLVAAPIQFDRTTLTPQELVIAELMKNSKDDLLALWGVPYSIIGGASPSGLNSGDTRKYDEAAIWQGPVHHRLTVFTETTQYGMLDRYAARGAAVELEIEEPEFDDDSPRYDLLGKSLSTPMRSVERRALVGLPPFGDPILDNEVILPSTQVKWADAPDESGASTATEVALGRAPAQITAGNQQDSAAPMAAAGEAATPTAKAVIPSRLGDRVKPLHSSLTRYRDHAQAKYTPLLKTSVGDVLHAQRADIVARLRKHAAAIEKQPKDASLWFSPSWDAKLRRALAPRLEAVAQVVNAQIHDVLPPKPAKAGPPGAVERVMERGAARVTGINQTTRDKINEAIIRGIDDGMSVLDVADLIESGGEIDGLDMGSVFDDYRAELIARTELMDAYNAAAIGSYSDAGVTEVQAIDGDGDEECADRDGQTFSIEDADSIEDHPNGTLDWVPILPDEEAKASPVVPQAQHIEIHNHLPEPIIINANAITVPQQVSPTVNVAAPSVSVAAPTVNVAAATVPEPIVIIPPAEKRTTKIDRDRSGQIIGSHDV